MEETSEEIKLNVTCPDFEEIARQMASKKIEITAKNLRKTIKNDSITNKEYVFTVSELSEKEINKSFLDIVAYDMMVCAIQEVEYQEQIF